MFTKLTNRKGVQYIEYALLAALIAVALITATTNLKGGIEKQFGKVQTQLEK